MLFIGPDVRISHPDAFRRGSLSGRPGFSWVKFVGARWLNILLRLEYHPKDWVWSIHSSYSGRAMPPIKIDFIAIQSQNKSSTFLPKHGALSQSDNDATFILRPPAVAKVAAARKLAIGLYWMLRTHKQYSEIVSIESSSRVPLVVRCEADGPEH
jgi:hypothetical protein